MRRARAVAALVLLAAACPGVPRPLEAPQVELRAASLTADALAAELSVVNPNHEGLTLEAIDWQLDVDDQPLDLNARDWALLSFLAQTPGKVVAKEEVSAALYGIDGEVSINAIDQIMSRFRKRLADSGLTLHTVRGLGYYLQVDDGSS